MLLKSLHLRMAVIVLALLLPMSALAQEVTLNFKNADIRAFIEFVSGFSGKNFLVDNRVKGSVTIISPTPISEKQAYDVFLSVLEVNGFDAVESGAVVKIVPRAESKQKAGPVMTGQTGDNDATVTQVIRIKHANAQQLVALLRPLVSPNSHLVAYPDGNMLLLTDAVSNIRRIQKILKLVDRKDAIGVRLFPLKYASADKLASTLTSLYAGGGAPGSPNSVKVMAHQPGNVLVVVAAAQVGNEIAEVVEKLDISPQADSGRLHVRYLKHANAEDIAKVLNELVSGQTPGSAAAPGSKPLFTGTVKVVADPATNALLITADSGDVQAVNQIVDRLDIRRLQVLIEALIVEVTGNVGEQLGIEWFAGKDIKQGQYSVVGGQNYGAVQGVGSAVAAAPAGTDTTLAVAGALQPGLTVGLLQGSLAAGTVSIGSLVQALETTGDANVLSTPNIVAMDNEEAEIVVGQNVPFVTGQNSTQGGISNPFQTIERKDIGLTLKVTPQISEGNSVRLEIFQEVSSISTDPTAGATDLITNKRSVKTVALARDNQMLVLGGLMREDTTATVRQVPCFGAVPLIGELFKSTQNSTRKVNLMVFLRPRIIHSESDMQTITQEKYLNIKGLYEKPGPQGTIIFPDHKSSLPEDFKPEQSAPNGGAEAAKP